MIARAAFSILNLPIINRPPANPSKRRTTSSPAWPKTLAARPALHRLHPYPARRAGLTKGSPGGGRHDLEPRLIIQLQDECFNYIVSQMNDLLRP
jgi:hypothetical protein